MMEGIILKGLPGYGRSYGGKCASKFKGASMSYPGDPTTTILRIWDIHQPGRAPLVPGNVYWLEGGHDRTFICRYRGTGLSAYGLWFPAPKPGDPLNSSLTTNTVHNILAYEFQFLAIKKRSSRIHNSSLRYVKFTAWEIEKRETDLPLVFGWDWVSEDFSNLFRL